MDLFDTHFHLPGEGSLEHYLDELESIHNYRLLALGSSLTSSQRALEFASKHRQVWCACGVHPHDAEEFNGDTAPFEEMFASSRVRAVGEIGLDFFYDYSPRELQKKCFGSIRLWNISIVSFFLIWTKASQSVMLQCVKHYLV